MLKKLIIIAFIGWLVGAGIYTRHIMICHAQMPKDTSNLAALVFTGGKDRITHGFQLLLNKEVSHLFITGVGDQITLTQILEEHGTKAMQAKPLRFWQSRVTLGYKARSTIGNAAEVTEWAADGGHQLHERVVLVTSNYHMPRSHLLLRQALPNSDIYHHPVIDPAFTEGSWWKKGGWIPLILSEYHKFLISWSTLTLMRTVPPL